MFDGVDPLTDNFLLFVDPLMKSMYQVDLSLRGDGPQRIHGIDLPTSNIPGRVAYDQLSRAFYWHDNEFDGLNSIKRMSLAGDVSQHVLTVRDHGNSYVVRRRFI